MLKPRGRKIALFPGAFRPPHRAHLAAILDLSARPDVDEVVVIVANRCRYIPGTTLALDASSAQRVLSIYLREVPKARVELARHDAVSHALGYLDLAAPGDSLLFCVGEADFARGDDRFEPLRSRKAQDGVRVTTVSAPTGSLSIRATALREALARGEAGRAEFVAGLPPQLSAEHSEEVWSICRSGLRSVSEIVREKLLATLDPKLIVDLEELSPVIPDKLDPVFRLRRRGKGALFIKYAGDTTEAGGVGNPLIPKPRGRLSAERRALKLLRTLGLREVELAELIGFDRETLTLVMSEVCAGGESLQNQLERGLFDPRVAATASGFLATCHATPASAAALRGDAELDRQHWRAMLDLRTTGIESPLLSPTLREDLRPLAAASDAARARGFFHLDFCPKNIRVGEGKLGVIDLELCSSIGDPAVDLGSLLGQIVLWGIRHSAREASGAALAAAIHAYRHGAGPRASSTIEPRVAGFAGASILSSLARGPESAVRGFEARLLRAAASLLSRNAGAAPDVERSLKLVLSAG